MAAIGSGNLTFFISDDYKIVKAGKSLLQKANINDEKQIVGALCYRVFFNRDFPCDSCPVSRAVAFKTVVEENIKIDPTDDFSFSRHAVATPIADNDGQVHRLVVDCLGANITIFKARKKLNDTINDPQARPNAATGAAKRVLLDNDLTIILYNQGVEDVLLKKDTSVVGYNLFSVAPWYNRPEIRTQVEDFVFHSNMREQTFDTVDETGQRVFRHHIEKLLGHGRMETVLLVSEPVKSVNHSPLKEFAKIISQFASRLSHDIKNPLALISTNLEFIVRDHGHIEGSGRTRPVMEYAEKIHQQVNNIVDILDFSNSLKVHALDALGESDFAQLLNRVVTITLLNNPYTKTDIRLDIQDNLPRILTSEIYLERALTELLKAALHKTGANGMLSIQLTYTGPAPDSFILAIRSNQCLQPISDLDSLLREFCNMKREWNEADIGLTIAYATILVHDGAMTISHSENGESLIEATLPRVPRFE